jgi:hypothetical protein
MNFSFLGFCFLIGKKKSNLIYMGYADYSWVSGLTRD